MNDMHKEQGLIKAILLVLIALIMLSYMGIDLEKAVAEPLFKRNLQYSGELIKKGWDKVMGLVSKESDASLNTPDESAATASAKDAGIDDLDIEADFDLLEI